MNNQYGNFTKTSTFQSLIETDVGYLYSLSGPSPKSLASTAAKQKDTAVASAVKGYETRKAALIQTTLSTYVSDNEYDMEEGNEGYETYKAAEKALSSTSGTGFLKYQQLVDTIDSSALDSSFDYTSSIVIDSKSGQTWNAVFDENSFRPSIKTVEKDFSSSFDETVEDWSKDRETTINNAQQKLSELKSFKYYCVSTDGTVFTNLSKNSTPKEVLKNSIYGIYENNEVVVKGIDSGDTSQTVKNKLNTGTGNTIYFYLDMDKVTNDNLVSDDAYAKVYSLYENDKSPTGKELVFYCVTCLLLSLVLLVMLLNRAGHKQDADEVSVAGIDKMPTDIHFWLSWGLIAAVMVGFYYLCKTIVQDAGASIFNSTEAMLILAGDTLSWFLAAGAVLCFLLFTEWLSSVVRIEKTHYGWWKHTLFWIFFSWIGRGIKKFSRAIAYKPKKFTKSVVTYVCFFFLINLILMLIGKSVSWILLIIFNAFCLYYLLRYIRILDKIIDASSRHEDVDLGSEKVPVSLKMLAENLSKSNADRDKAVAQAVRDEQMKTELITNVSHDLKTPLTSLINYSDLLGKCDIRDEDAQKYIKVINNQSIKLKRLIEDLIEASKVSSGNVQLNKSQLSFNELAVQAIAEYAPETEKNDNEIVYREPKEHVGIFADGPKTYRILSNLLNNAKKYSMTGTRIYISVSGTPESGMFEIKNTSAQPLNITPEELTQRFVRGDKSRGTREGNGLGLSIAKDLCELQGGELKLQIDGDLFKATVILPCRPSKEEQKQQDEAMKQAAAKEAAAKTAAAKEAAAKTAASNAANAGQANGSPDNHTDNRPDSPSSGSLPK